MWNGHLLEIILPEQRNREIESFVKVKRLSAPAVIYFF